MSKSFHVTGRDFRGKTKEELDAMAKDPDALLHQCAEKSIVKREVIKKRRNKKRKSMKVLSRKK